MAAMDLAALGHLIDVDWSQLCETRFFCFGCSSAMCAHCCDRQRHRQSHHPHRAGDPLRVETIGGGRLAVEVVSFQGCGYSRNGIQRVAWHGRDYILILPVDADALRSQTHCQGCQHLIKSGWTYCSLGCRANHSQEGRRRQVALRFVQLAGQGQFGPPVQVKDQYCTICRRAFCSASCPSHSAHGHPDQPLYPAAGPDDVKNIIRIDGWVAIPHDQLPDNLVHNVQAVQGPGGIMAYPLHRREHPQPPLGFQLGQPHNCHRPGCGESFYGIEPFCSLRCRHQG